MYVDTILRAKHKDKNNNEHFYWKVILYPKVTNTHNDSNLQIKPIIGTDNHER